MQVEGTRMLRVRAVAEQFDVHPATIYRAIQTGALPALRLGMSKGLRVPEAAVKSWINSRVVAAADTASNHNATAEAAGGAR